MNDAEPRYISSDGPINLRHARPHERAGAPQVAEEALARVQRAHARHLVGTALEAQFQAALPSDARRRTPRSQIAGAIAAASGGVLLLLGVIQSSWTWGLAGGAALALAVAGLVWTRRGDSGAVPAPRRLFDAETLRRFDDAVDRAAAELSETACQQLQALKSSLVRIGTRALAAGFDEHFTIEDHMFLVECMRRYIPDTLQAYMVVPAPQRRAAAATPDGETAEALLARQLGLLQAELDRREEALGRSTTQALVRQQQFLESKRSR